MHFKIVDFSLGGNPQKRRLDVGSCRYKARGQRAPRVASLQNRRKSFIPKFQIAMTDPGANASNTRPIQFGPIPVRRLNAFLAARQQDQQQKTPSYEIHDHLAV